MKATEFIEVALENGRMWLEALLADIDGKDAVTAPTSRGGNHPLWALGHMTYSEAMLIGGCVRNDKPSMPDLEALFGKGVEPVADASKYPSKAQLLERYRAVRKETLAVLHTLSDADLDRETTAQKKELFGTVGRCFALLISHQAFHAGQIADARRAMGRKPVVG